MSSDYRLLTDPLVRWAQQRPETQAVIIGEESLTYEQLLCRASSLANTLIAHEIAKGDRVGLYLDKSLEAVVAIYGILLAGAAYVPLDVSAPPARTSLLIRDCDLQILVSSKAKRRQLAQLELQSLGVRAVVGVDDSPQSGVIGIPWAKVWGAPGKVPQRSIIELDLSYIIYTSGSTGVPKGIMHSHSSGMSYARWAAAEYALSATDKIGNHSPFHFDISIFDLFATAIVGAAMVLIPEPVLKMPASYSQLLQDEGVSVLFTVPFALIQLHNLGVLDQRDLRRLRWIIFGGEPFPPAQLKALMQALPQTLFDNMYGPAEVNGCTHYTLVDSDFDGNVPIGRPAAIADIRLVDEDNALVGVGQVGELLVRTPTKMHGYWGRPDLTEQASWYADGSIPVNACYYRTGDLVRARIDGVLEFVGRRDRQIKLRGYRIELDEIELALNSNKAIEEAAAYVLSKEGGEKCLAVQVRLSSTQVATETQTTLIAFLRKQLPWYAVPQAIVVVAEFPRTTSGKIDRLLVEQRAQATADKEHQETKAHG